jgi:DNA mismatch repair ATPase MutS
VLSLEGFGLAGKQAAASAAGAILYYIRSTQRGTLDHVDRIGFYERQNCLVLDAVTVRNLELIEPLFAGTDAGVTLFRCLDATVTPMGKRLLRTWMLRPSLDRVEIEGRLDSVEVQVKDTVRREELRRALDGILDLERLLSRVTLETANPRDVLALAASLGRIPKVRAVLGWDCSRRPRGCCTLHKLSSTNWRSAGENRSHAGSRAAADAERWRRDCRRRRQGSRRTPRPEPQLEAISGAGGDSASASGPASARSR